MRSLHSNLRALALISLIALITFFLVLLHSLLFSSKSCTNKVIRAIEPARNTKCHGTTYPNQEIVESSATPWGVRRRTPCAEYEHANFKGKQVIVVALRTICLYSYTFVLPFSSSHRTEDSLWCCSGSTAAAAVGSISISVYKKK